MFSYVYITPKAMLELIQKVKRSVQVYLEHDGLKTTSAINVQRREGNLLFRKEDRATTDTGMSHHRRQSLTPDRTGCTQAHLLTSMKR